MCFVEAVGVGVRSYYQPSQGETPGYGSKDVSPYKTKNPKMDKLLLMWVDQQTKSMINTLATTETSHAMPTTSNANHSEVV